MGEVAHAQHRGRQSRRFDITAIAAAATPAARATTASAGPVSAGTGAGPDIRRTLVGAAPSRGVSLTAILGAPVIRSLAWARLPAWLRCGVYWGAAPSLALGFCLVVLLDRWRRRRRRRGGVDGAEVETSSARSARQVDRPRKCISANARPTWTARRCQRAAFVPVIEVRSVHSSRSTPFGPRGCGPFGNVSIEGRLKVAHPWLNCRDSVAAAKNGERASGPHESMTITFRRAIAMP